MGGASIHAEGWTAPASGCASSPFKVTVLDDRRFPTITFATLESTSCNNEFDGQITVTATSPGFNPATTNYDFVWTSTPGGSVVISNQLATLSAPVFQSEALGGPVGFSAVCGIALSDECNGATARTAATRCCLWRPCANRKQPCAQRQRSPTQIVEPL